MAGDAVTIAPVSSQTPCKQGIFQGIPENSAPKVAVGIQETAVLQRLLAEFPTTTIRETILENREFRLADQGKNASNAGMAAIGLGSR